MGSCIQGTDPRKELAVLAIWLSGPDHRGGEGRGLGISLPFSMLSGLGVASWGPGLAGPAPQWVPQGPPKPLGACPASLSFQEEDTSPTAGCRGAQLRSSLLRESACLWGTPALVA